MLENRLDKAMIKYNEAQSIRKTYEQIVKRLKEERVGFDNQLGAIERPMRVPFSVDVPAEDPTRPYFKVEPDADTLAFIRRFEAAAVAAAATADSSAIGSAPACAAYAALKACKP